MMTMILKQEDELVRMRGVWRYWHVVLIGNDRKGFHAINTKWNSVALDGERDRQTDIERVKYSLHNAAIVDENGTHKRSVIYCHKDTAYMRIIL